MEFYTTKLPKSQMEIEITVPFAELAPHLKKAAELISGEVEIKGFRKGRAPYEIVKEKFGEQAIYERAADLAARKVWPEILRELVTSNQLPVTTPPIGHPEIAITEIAPGHELKLKIKISLLPQIVLPDYKTIAREIKKDKKEISVAEEEAEKTLRWIRESRTKLITVARAAEAGDAVEIDFEARQSGVKIADGESRNHPLVLGEDKFLPGFEEKIKGMKAGDDKIFTIEVPEDWRDKNIAGKELEFKVSLKLVQERQVPALDDNFAKSLGNFSSLAELKKNVREGLLKEKEEKERERLRVAAVEAIADKIENPEVPDVLIESELDKMLEELKSGAENMGLKWDDYLLHLKKSLMDLRREWRDGAEKRVKIALVLREIGRAENLSPADEEVEKRANEFLNQFKSAEEARKNIDPEELKEYAKSVLRNEKVFEFLENLA